MKASPIRSHLLLLVLAMSVPLVSVVGLGIYSDMRQTIAHTKASLRTLANMMVSNTGSKIANARQTLERLGIRPLVRQLDPNNCDGILKDLLNLNPDYANVTYTDLDGVAVCSAVPQPGGKPVNVGDAPWFRKFLKERRFIVSEPFFGPITGKWVSVLSAPIWDASHEMVGGVQLPLDINAFDPNIPTQFLPAGSRYGFSDENRVLIWRNVDPEGVIGTQSDAEVAYRIIAIRDGEFESVGSDGVKRFYSVVPMAETGWFAFIGVPASEVYLTAQRRALTASLLALGAIFLLVLFALSISRRIAKPIAALARTARLVRTGDIGAKAAVEGPKEVAEVAKAFNSMTEELRTFTDKLTAEIAERKQMEEQVRQLALHDTLTLLPNRRLLDDRLAQAMAASKRSGCHGAVIFLDLDNFKPLNDTHGHAVGDLLLIEVAERLKACIREMDTVARFGGDEFAVVLGELNVDQAESTTQAEIVAEKIRAALSEPYVLTVKQVGQADITVEHHCTASIGVALFLNHLARQDDILKWADAAMYQAKDAGRNSIRFHAAAS